MATKKSSVKKKTSKVQVNDKKAEKQNRKPALKNQTPVWLIVSIVAVVIIGALLIMWQYGLFDQKTPSTNTPGVENKVIVTVNDQPVTLSQLKDEYDKLPVYLRSQITESQLLDQMIDEIVLVQAAENAGYKMSDAQVSEALNDLLAANSLTQAQLEESIQAQGITMDDFLVVFKKRMIITRFLNDTIMTPIVISEQDVKAFYDANPDQFVEAERVHARHVLVATQEEAMQVRKDVLAGQDFKEVAAAKSTDPSAATNGGDLGFFTRGQMVKPFEEVAFSLKTGDISQPVQTDFGWHIIQVLDHTPARTVAFSEAANAIAQTLRSQQATAAVETYLKDLRTEANIKYVDASYQSTAATVEVGAGETEVASSGTSTTVTIGSQSDEQQTVNQETDVGKCIAESGAKVYGAYWNQDTLRQIEIVGTDAMYVECGVEDDYAAQTAVCKSEGITGYPTWKIGGSVYASVLDISRLKELTGC